ncbi:MAG: hypothetical protein IJQ21_09165 [Lachnospiraceae bacterium]|nr:hypothetical protein [Lachnospiraceae bacterium]
MVEQDGNRAGLKPYLTPPGVFTYTTEAFGHDHGFLAAWFLILAYVAVMWANATAVVLVARNHHGDTFQTGFYYQIAGYDIYLGEACRL